MRIADADLQEVWTEYRRAPTDALRDRLVERYLPLVRHVAERLSRSLPSFVDVDDLASMGIFGLLDAIGRFDPTMGVRFRTYAARRIRGGILDELRAMDWVPRLVRIKRNQAEKARVAVERRLAREPTFYELACELRLDFGEVDALLRGGTATSMISLGDETGGESASGSPRIELLRDPHPSASPMREAQLKDIREAVARHLCEKERLVVVLYYYEELSMKQIAQVLGLTESRICQIHGKVIRRLEEQLARIRADLFV